MSSFATPGTQGAGATGAGDGQPPSGQPTGTGQGQGGFNWGLFPNVPEEQRALLEPHLREVLGHVTKIEQQWAPYKFIQERQMNPEQLQGILSFSDAFDQDPVNTWYSMAKQMGENGLLPEDLDLEDLSRILQGLPPVEEPGAPGTEGAPPTDPAIQQLMQAVQQLTEQVQGVTQYVQTQQQNDQQREQDALLDRSVAGMKEQLKAAGFPEQIFGDEDGQISDQYLVGQLVAHRGDSTGAVQSINTLRNGILKGFSETAQNGSGKPLEMPHGAPPTPNRSSTDSTDGFDKAKAGALNYLRQNQAAAAQE